MNSDRGWCAVGVWHGKKAVNIGTLWRSAVVLGADFVFTIGRRYTHQPSDTFRAPRHVPLWHFADLADFFGHLPSGGTLIGVELDERAVELERLSHPERAVYLLGAEDHGLSDEAMGYCHQLVRLPGERSLNVATAGSIVLYDRHVRGTEPAPTPLPSLEVIA